MKWSGIPQKIQVHEISLLSEACEVRRGGCEACCEVARALINVLVNLSKIMLRSSDFIP